MGLEERPGCNGPTDGPWRVDVADQKCHCTGMNRIPRCSFPLISATALVVWWRSGLPCGFDWKGQSRWLCLKLFDCVVWFCGVTRVCFVFFPGLLSQCGGVAYHQCGSGPRHLSGRGCDRGTVRFIKGEILYHQVWVSLALQAVWKFCPIWHH